MNKNLKSGQFVFIGKTQYLFLGYSDYKRLWGVVADQYGNKMDVYSQSISTSQE